MTDDAAAQRAQHMVPDYTGTARAPNAPNASEPRQLAVALKRFDFRAYGVGRVVSIAWPLALDAPKTVR